MFFLHHPGFVSVDPTHQAELDAYIIYCVAHQFSMLRKSSASHSHSHQLNVYAFSIGRRQRRALLYRGAVLCLLARRLMHVQGQRSMSYPYYTRCVVSQSHFIVSRNAKQNLFNEGLHFYREKRYEEAAKSWSQAALLRHGPSHAYLSNLLIEGRQFLKKNEKRAFEFASYGALFGCAHSKGVLGYCLVYGVGVSKDVEKGLVLASESAAAGSSFGEFTLGKYHGVFRGFSQNYDEAERLYRLAAAKGHACAQHNLGFMFEVGLGVAKDDTEAIRWYHIAATQGHADAQCKLGMMFKHGRGVAKNLTEAIHWYRLAAAQGHKQAKSNIQHLIRIREGVS